MPLLTCPNDNTPMQVVQRGGVELDICPTCRGVWLDRGELEKLLGQLRTAEREYEDELAGYRPQGQPSQPPYAKPRNPYDTDHGYDDDDYKRKKKSKLSKLFDIFD
ncbi:MAG TPA: zf-TFIIB domain-containing protein [Meiothermus sp.]|nr:zf-TFIIB domain-containing protein [Meiothermus sp.]